MRRFFNGLPGAVDIGGIGPRQGGNLRLSNLTGDLLHGQEVAVGRDRESRLDDIYTELFELSRDSQFFVQVHACSW